MARPADDGELRLRRGLIALLLAIAGAGALDLVLDRPGTLWSFHALFELAFIGLSLGGALYLWRGWLRTRRSLAGIRAELESQQAERDAWRARASKLLRGLGEAMDAQMRDWGLTPAERETAVLLLKGYATKEIAELLGKSERTVRQHAVATYRKSGLSGRAGLSAFFLEDLLLPLEGEREGERGPAP